MAVVHLLFHSLIGHKEYRFVLLTAALLVILAAIGTADLLRRVPRGRLMIAAAGVMAVWAGGSAALAAGNFRPHRSEEHTSELQSLMRISYAVFCLTQKKTHNRNT